MRGEWIEINKERWANLRKESLPMRGEWIEILMARLKSGRFAVSPHAGRVD